MTSLRYSLSVLQNEIFKDVALKSDVEKWRDAIANSHRLCEQTINVALQVLGGRVHDDEGERCAMVQMYMYMYMIVY